MSETCRRRWPRDCRPSHAPACARPTPPDGARAGSAGGRCDRPGRAPSYGGPAATPGAPTARDPGGDVTMATMDLSDYVDALRSQLTAVAAAGTEQTRETAR